MTCFWDGIMNKLGRGQMEKYLGCADSPRNFVLALRARLGPINDVMWNGALISEQEMTESATWIRSYDVEKISQGHDCSVCDPFLILICHIFIVDIIHDYNGHEVIYKNINNRTKNVLTFSSNTGHFS